MRLFILVIIGLCTLPVFSQLAPNTYWIQFTDKNNTIYSLNEPEIYLSERSLERRTRYNIAIDSTDFPVNDWYLDSVRAKGGVVLRVSKWLNGCAVYSESQSILNQIYELEFVDEESSTSESFSMNFTPYNIGLNIATTFTDYYEYGSAITQIDMHNGAVLHDNGFCGEGMMIALLDGGFQGLDETSAFDSLFVNDQIIDTWDFVEENANVYNDHYHGKACLSTIAANLPSQMVGTAPKADFLLYRTENVSSEYKIEEINWILAAEKADSIGTDIISSSLGYNLYQNPSNSYTWEDLDGKTASISIAADMAAEKGILVVSSAGNEGNKEWIKIGAPADAKNILTVGACNVNGQITQFSSRGNTQDGRIKPDVVALGQSTTVITSINPIQASGTSYSAPIITGLSACLWQVNRGKSNFQIMDLVRSKSSHYLEPDSLFGYGIPNFESAYNTLIQEQEVDKLEKEQIVSLYPSPFSNQVNLNFYSLSNQSAVVSLKNIQGVICYSSRVNLELKKVNILVINDIGCLPEGVYVFSVQTKDNALFRKVICTH